MLRWKEVNRQVANMDAAGVVTYGRDEQEAAAAVLAAIAAKPAKEYTATCNLCGTRVRFQEPIPRQFSDWCRVCRTDRPHTGA